MTDKDYSKILATKEGYDNPMDMVSDFITSNIVPAICTNGDCLATYEYEPDSTQGYCDICQSNEVKSILVLEGY